MDNNQRPSFSKQLIKFLLPSALLFWILIVYFVFDGWPHFFLHLLIGWDIALLGLLAVTYYTGQGAGQKDGLWPLTLALFALLPDFFYAAGQPHRDWMDLFLFHIGLDEILPFALPTEAFLTVVLLIGYWHYRLPGTSRSHNQFNHRSD